MKKSLVSLLLLVAMMFNIFAFTSCFGGGTGDIDLTGEYDGSAVSITFWHSMGQENRALLDSAIARFNEIYPNIKVEHTSLGDYDTVFSTIRTKLTAGQQPNFAFCYPDHVATYNESESVICLDDLINNKNVIDASGEMMGFTDAQIADFIPAYYNEGKSYGDGKMYSIAFQKSTEVLYYNKTVIDPILAELGLETIATWDDVEAIIAILKDKYPKSIPLGYDSSENFFVTLSIQNDAPYTSANGEHYLFNNDKSKAFVAKFAEWHQKGWMTTSELMGGSYTSDAFKKGNEEDNKVFMSIGSSAGARYQRPDKDGTGNYPFEVGILPVPQVEGSKKVISQGPSVCIFESDNVQEIYASWLLVKFLTTDAKFQAEYSMKSGYVPVIQSVYETKQYQDSLAKANGGDFITALAAKVALAQKDYYFTSPAFPGSADARTQVGLLVEGVFTKYQLGADNSAMINEQFTKFYNICKEND